MESEQQQFKFCTNCGAKNVKGAKFCKQCGTPFSPNRFQTDKNSEQEPHREESRSSVMGSATAKLNSWTGGHGEVKISLRSFFSEVFKKHTQTEAEEIFIVGTPKTTPSIESVSAQEVHPWLFSRVFVFVLLLSALLYVLLNVSGQTAMFIVMLIFIGVAVPVSALVLFFESNALKSVSFYQVIKIALIGGILSLIVTMIAITLFGQSDSHDIGLVDALLIGLREEAAKVLVAAYFVYRMKPKTIFEGLLIGAAVGTGFSAFENIQYIINGLNDGGGIASAFARTMSSVSDHTEWCAISSAGLIIASNKKVFRLEDLFDIKFLRFFILVVIIHALWDWTLKPYDLIKETVAFVATWTTIFVLIHAALREIAQLKQSARVTDAVPTK